MVYKENKLKLSKVEVLRKIRNWCAYQERSHFETRIKLSQFDLSSFESEEIISELISENYINEQRFAEALAGGKFRIKNWGKVRILMELKKHKVSEYSITKALKTIEEKDYQTTLNRLLEKKMNLIKSKNTIQLRATLYKYLLSKGYEPERINTSLNDHLKNVK